MNLKDRRLLVIVLFMLITLVFIARLFQLQVLDPEWKVKAAQIRQKRPDAPVERVEQTVQSVPDLRDHRLPQVVHLKIDQPRHDDVRNHDPPRDAKDQ